MFCQSQVTKTTHKLEIEVQKLLSITRQLLKRQHESLELRPSPSYHIQKAY